MLLLNRPVAMLFFIAILILGGCGGGGGDGFSGDDPGFGGLWEGTFTFDDSLPDEFVGISTDISNGGRFEFLLPESGIQMSGTATFDGLNVSGDGLAYAPLGEFFSGGVTVSAFTFAGTLQPGSTLTADWEFASGEMGSFALAYDSEYERNASLSQVAGTWTQYDEFLNPTVSFSIDSNGAIFGQSAACVSSGLISVPDAAFNAYQWQTTVTGMGCPISGDYIGLGTLGDNEAASDSLVILASNLQRALLILLQRD